MKVSDITYSEISGTEDFQHVVSVELGGSYDWDSLEAWYSPSKRRFFWLEGEGCSCDYLGSGIGRLDDFSSGNRDELARALRDKYDGAYNARPTDLINDLATLKKFRATN